MISVRQDTLAAVEAIERRFGKTSFHQAKKIEHLDAMLTSRLDFERLYSALGIRPGAGSSSQNSAGA
jgi:BioD-like phosphotransacetylase family protein